MSVFGGALDYFVKGGPIMWPLLFCSIGAIVIGVERYLYYKQSISGTKFTMEFCDLLDAGKLDEAKQLSTNSNGKGAKLAAEVLNIKEDMGSRLESFVYARVDRIVDKLEAKLNYLSVIIGLSPMLGLLGTITGMISSFNALNERAQNPMAVTAGIGEALITTVFGLCIAIMGMCIHAYLSSRVKTESLNLDELAAALIDTVSARNSHK